MMQIIGTLLILLVIGLYIWWIRFLTHQKGVSAKEEEGIQIFNVEVKGVYSPSTLKVKKGMPVKINFTRKESTDCSGFINFPDFKIRKELPENKTISIELTPERKGEYTFTCDMSMYQGKLIVE
jgi:plastocyanin domain-containing protein